MILFVQLLGGLTRFRSFLPKAETKPVGGSDCGNGGVASGRFVRGLQNVAEEIQQWSKGASEVMTFSDDAVTSFDTDSVPTS